jgi:hypothetical protein
MARRSWVRLEVAVSCWRTERGCVGDQPQQLGNECGLRKYQQAFPSDMLRLVEDDTTALRQYS